MNLFCGFPDMTARWSDQTLSKYNLERWPGLKLGNRDQQAFHIVSWTAANKCPQNAGIGKGRGEMISY
jgi:hypothetical protein